MTATQETATGQRSAGYAHVDVSVLVPVLDEEEHLRGCVERMLAQDLDGRAEFLFLDGGSRDRSREILEEIAAVDPRVRVLDNPARRTPHALNVGLQAARGTFVARMDAHTHYPPDYLSIGLARLRRGDVVSVSGPQIAHGRGRWSRRVALALQTPLGVGGARFRVRATQESEVESGFTGVWSRQVLLDAGGWDEQWVNDQDTELAARLRKAGGRIVCLPEMAASYVPRDSLPTLWSQYGRYGYYRVLTSHRHPETMRPGQLLPAALVTVLAAAGLPGRGRTRRVARTAAAGYVLALAATAATQRHEAPPRDVITVPVVLATMHLGYGTGFLRACLRTGLPARALAGALRRLA